MIEFAKFNSIARWRCRDLAAKALVHSDGFYFTQTKNERANIYAFDFMAHRGLIDFFMRYRTARHERFIAAFSDKWLAYDAEKGEISI